MSRLATSADSARRSRSIFRRIRFRWCRCKAEDMQLIDDEIIRRTLEAARQSPRRRMNHNFHSGPEDNPHRFLNVMLRDTYVAPHRHLRPPKAESFLVLEGCIVIICFEEDG